MDQLTAHLDRGWDLAQRGDAIGAESSARSALDLEDDSPEAHNLLGYSHALKGDHEEALELYQQAIALDDTFLDAVLNAAELCIHPLADPEAALAFCQDALLLVSNQSEVIDVLLLQFDAYLALGQVHQAQAICAQFPAPPYERPIHSLLIGRALFETGEVAGAEPLLRIAHLAEPANADVHYYLALIHDDKGEVDESVREFLRTRTLDLREELLSFHLAEEDFEELVQATLLKLSPRLHSLIRASYVHVGDLPGVEVIVEGADPRAPIILDAVEGSDTPMRIFVYQRNIERIAGALEQIEPVLLACLEQEVAGFAFGESEAPSEESGTLN